MIHYVQRVLATNTFVSQVYAIIMLQSENRGRLTIIDRTAEVSADKGFFL